MRTTRRALLKQLGLGPFLLPLLPAATARAAGTANRLLCVVHTGGYRQAHWRPPEGPLTGTLPASAAPLQPWKDRLIFLPELANPHHRGSPEGAYACAFYGLPQRTTAADYPEPLGRTVDQVVARALPGGPARSLALHVQIDLPPVPPERGASRCFWAGPDRPVVPEGDPTAVYRRLFAGRPGDPAISRLLLERRSVLDVVGKTLNRWRDRLGIEDRVVVDGHLNAVREFERSLGGAQPATCVVPAAGADPRDPALWPKLLDAQLALAVAAMSCGHSPVVTLQLSNAIGASIDFGLFVPGIPARTGGYRAPPTQRSWLELARNGTMNGTNIKRLIDQWLMQKLADLLGRLNGLPGRGNLSLLDDSVVLWGSQMRDGDGPSDDPRVAWLLAGKGGGALETGQCAATAGKPLSGVLADVCTAFGVPGQPFGPGHGGLLA
jgi:hypothetical protein